MFHDIEETAQFIRNAIKDIPKRYSDNLDEITHLEKERSDWIHLMELRDLGLYEGWKAYKGLQKVERKRRKLKDENIQLKYLAPVLKEMNGKVTKLNESIGSIRKEKVYLEKRSYRTKVRKDLEKVINGVEK